jgi:large subunit ribosomal protein L19
MRGDYLFWRSIKMDLLKAFVADQLKADAPKVEIGDTVRVYNKIVEGSRTRTQIFEGTVIAKRNSGISETFTVRRIAYGVGVEKTFNLHSPTVEKVETVRIGKVRRAKLYYLRDRVGKAAKTKEQVR